MYGEYWRCLSEQGIVPQKYSWRFDRNGFCDIMFNGKEKILVERGQYYQIPMKDGFLPRFLSRGFSDQVLVPEEQHRIVTQKLIAKFKERYGERFDEIVFKGNEEDILLTVYRK